MIRTTLLLLSLFLASCGDGSFQTVSKKGELTVITRNNNFSYYSYRNEKMGFEYDLIKEFADRNKLQLNVLVMHDWQEMVDAIKSKKADIIATNMTVTETLRNDVAFMKPHLHDAKVIVVNKRNREIRKGTDLKGKKLVISANASYKEKSQELMSRYPGLEVVVNPDMDSHEILEKVSNNEIYGTITDLMVYKLNKPFYPNIRELFSVSRTVDIAWAVNKKDSKLLEKLNQFLGDIIDDGYYRKTYLRYFSTIDSINEFNIYKFKQLYRNVFPIYKRIVENEAERRNIDWRLVAAIMFQESHFKPNARSHRGAKGLMQLMPNTIRMLISDGDEKSDSASANISAGIKYLAQLKKTFTDIPENQLIYFITASYNVGPGHILDAIELSESMGLDGKEWVNIEKVLPLLMKEEYYAKTKHGYCRATETLKYVRNIMLYYGVLKEKDQDLLEEVPDSVIEDEARDI